MKQEIIHTTYKYGTVLTSLEIFTCVTCRGVGRGGGGGGRGVAWRGGTISPFNGENSWCDTVCDLNLALMQTAVQ